MRKIDTEVIKNSKPFKKLDLLVYFLVLAIVASLFLCFGTCNADAIQSMAVFRNGETLFTYDFNSDVYGIFSDDVQAEREDGSVIVTVRTGQDGYNVVKIDVADRSFSVTDANCSARKDCVHSPVVTKAGQSAVCAPHSLVFAAEGRTPNRPVIG